MGFPSYTNPRTNSSSDVIAFCLFLSDNNNDDDSLSLSLEWDTCVCGVRVRAANRGRKAGQQQCSRLSAQSCMMRGFSFSRGNV